MYCLRCGTQNDDNAIYCRHCNEELDNNRYYNYQYSNNQKKDSESTYSKPMSHEEYNKYSYRYSNGQDHVPIKNQHEDQYNYSYNYSNEDVISGDEKYIANYVGPNYKIIKKSKFSIPTLIFGPLYFIYRKLYFYAFIWIIFQVAVSYYLPEYYDVIELFVTIFIATKFSTIYLDKVEQRVDKIKHESLDLTSSEILDKCTKVGGTFKNMPKLFISLGIILFFAIMAITMYVAIDEIDYEYNTNHQEYEPITNNNHINDLTYIIPEGFEETHSSTYTKTYYYDHYGDYCRIGIHYNNYVTATNDHEFLKNNIYIENEPLIYDTTINETTWATIKYQPNNNITYYNYGHIYNNNGYLINFDIINNTSGECETMHNNFINSLKLN